MFTSPSTPGFLDVFGTSSIFSPFIILVLQNAKAMRIRVWQKHTRLHGKLTASGPSNPGKSRTGPQRAAKL